MKKVLVTGGGGYIGSHICVELVQHGFEPVVVDNFCASDRRILERAGQIAGRAFAVHELDCRDSSSIPRRLASPLLEACGFYCVPRDDASTLLLAAVLEEDPVIGLFTVIKNHARESCDRRLCKLLGEFPQAFQHGCR